MDFFCRYKLKQLCLRYKINSLICYETSSFVRKIYDWLHALSYRNEFFQTSLDQSTYVSNYSQSKTGAMSLKSCVFGVGFGIYVALELLLLYYRKRKLTKLFLFHTGRARTTITPSQSDFGSIRQCKNRQKRQFVTFRKYQTPKH